MKRSTRTRFANRRRGAVAILIAICMTGLLGVIAIAVDGGMLQDKRRQAQEAADAAALAAASDLFEHYPKNKGQDSTGGVAKKSAQQTAKDNGFDDAASNCTVNVRIYPENYYAGANAGKALPQGYVEVVIEYDHPRYFSTLFGSDSTKVKARGVARGLYQSVKVGILVLNLHEQESLKINGNGIVTVIGAPIIVDSDDSQAVGGDGQGATVKASEYDITGGKKDNTTLLNPDGSLANPNYGVDPTPDPLAKMPPPTMPSTSFPKPNGENPRSATGRAALQTVGIDPNTVNGKVYVLEPGRYDNLPNFTNGDVVIMKQATANSQNGVYYLNGSGFTSTGATIKMDPNTSGGVMFYNNPTSNANNQGVSITGGNVYLRPPSSGVYQGMAIFQNRDATGDLQITGQGGINITGTFYAAKALMKITGSDSSNLDVIGSQYISDTLQSGGNGQYHVTWSEDQTAKTRVIQLVE